MRIIYPFVLIFFFIFINEIKAQVIITAEDMPDPGDTIRTSMTLDLEGIDYEATGEDYTWDFSGLTVMAQQVDTFVEVSSTPLLYQAVFNNQFIFPDYKATVALKLFEFNLIPNLEVTDAYQFFKETDEEYREVGVGITLSGVPLPVSYQQIDTLYRFPLGYGVADSSLGGLSLDVPGLGYLEVDRKRRNFADGWGTLITPYGQFEVLRVRTEIDEFDSVYIDSLNTGFPINRQYVEYKWMANGFSLPMLTITAEEFVVTATYIDSVRTTFMGIDEEVADYDFDFRVYPNPSSDYMSVSYELRDPSDVMISFYSLFGKEVKRVFVSQQDRGLYNKLINLREAGLSQGVYLLVLQVDGQARVKRVMVQ